MKKVTLILLLILINFSLVALDKLAIVRDKDGYTNIRSGKGTQFDIVEKIQNDEFVFCSNTKEEWLLVVALKFKKGEPIKGYIHKTHLLILEELTFDEQKKIISDVFDNFIKLSNERNRFFNKNKGNKFFKSEKDSIKALQYYNKDFKYVDSKYDPILGYFPTYYCKTKDTTTLKLLFSAMWADNGTANEQPSNTICDCYMCGEDLFLQTLNNIRNRAKLKFLIEDLEGGLYFQFNIDYNSKVIKDQKFKKLKYLLEEFKMKKGIK